MAKATEAGDQGLADNMKRMGYSEEETKKAFAAISEGVDDELEKALTLTGKSALCIAYDRSLESERPDALFKDPYAKQLAGVSGKNFAAALKAGAATVGFEGWPEYHQQWTAVRTAFLDNWIKEKLPKGGQVVNLGAGVCTRPFRLDCLAAASKIFEVDTKEVNAVKEKILATLNAKAVCPRVVLECDLSTDALKDDLLAVGFDPKVPTLWILEGLIMYLENAQSEALIRRLGPLSAAGSAVAVNYMGKNEKVVVTASKQFEDEHLKTILTESGWKAEYYHFGDKQLDFGRFNKDYKPNNQYAFCMGEKSET